MTSPAGARQGSERGNVLLLLLVALTGLAALGGITIVSTRGGLDAAGHDRFKTIALYAAESGAAAGMDYLRRQSANGVQWSALVSPGNDPPLVPGDATGNGARPGEDGNPFGVDLQAWFELEIVNNTSDPGFAAGDDLDHRLVLRVTGHGPDGAVARVEWEVRNNAVGVLAHCPAYGQRGLAEDGAGRNDCLTTINAGVVQTYTPGGN